MSVWRKLGQCLDIFMDLRSFLASPRSTMVASESEVPSSEAHAVGEKSAGSKPGALEEEWGKCDAVLMPACCLRPPSASRRDLHSALGG